MPREDSKGLPRWIESTFSFLLRNSSEAIDYFPSSEGHGC